MGPMNSSNYEVTPDVAYRLHNDLTSSKQVVSVLDISDYDGLNGNEESVNFYSFSYSYSHRANTLVLSKTLTMSLLTTKMKMRVKVCLLFLNFFYC